MQTILQSAYGVIGNSQDTLDNLQQFARTQHANMPPSLAAHLGGGGCLKGIHTDRPIKESYFVMLGTIEGRKNHIMILNVWRDMVRQYGASTPRLLVIGQRGWECEQAIDMLERCENLRDFVIEISNCTDIQLARYLKHAQALLFPSFVEGFGMPLVEALANKLPVIASDLAVFREISSNIPEFIHPLDALSWRKFIMDYSTSQSCSRIQQLIRMEGYQAPTWANHFAKVDHWLGKF
ncbi:glycosyltransferase [Chromobacterium violaceum]|uniref:glycosyltransferase n=1 Tax=Chromobacterium violaceum TaxID=536 RepID=UPI001B324AB2|nr:glycosyltransferase [Chromobacterium violaceum]MBP4044690.1 glycosyltransferase [Chromobacterium violaceum]